MSVDAWGGLIGSFVVLCAGGFGAWMFRIDRIATTVRHLADSLSEHKADSDRGATQIWSKLENHGITLGSHGERIAGLEAWKRGGDSCR